MRSARANNQVEAGFVWATANDNVWALMMVQGGNTLRLFTPVAGTCLEVSATAGVLDCPRGVTTAATVTARGEAAFRALPVSGTGPA